MNHETGGRIDVHAHLIPPAYREALERAGLDRIGGIPVPPWTPELALEFMDAHGIERQFLSVSDPGVGFLGAGKEAQSLARSCNDYLAEVIAEHSDRFGGFAVLPLDDADASIAEAQRCLDELSLAGVGLLSSAEGRYLGDESFDLLLEELNGRGAWAFVHPTAVGPGEKPATPVPDFIAEYPFDTTRTFISLLFGNCFARFPTIRWHFAHGAGAVPMLSARLKAAAKFAAVMAPVLGLPERAGEVGPDGADVALSASFYDTALIADTPSLQAVAAITSPDHVLFGSDWPFAGVMYPPEGDPQPALSEIFSSDREAIDRGNASAQLL